MSSMVKKKKTVEGKENKWGTESSAESTVL